MKKSIKYIVAILLAATSTLQAEAWEAKGHKIIAVLAERNLTPAARAEAERILGGSLKDNAMWLDEFRDSQAGKNTASWHTFLVDATLHSTTTDEGDAVVQIERAADILRNRAQYGDSVVVASLRTLIHLVADMHSVSHVKIENIEYSKQDFTFLEHNGHTGRKKEIAQRSWKKFWDAEYINNHNAFSPEYYAEDVAICFGDKADEIAKGSPRDWAYDMGRECKPLFDWAAPNYMMTRYERNIYERVVERGLARGGYRLAALLNECLQ